MLVSLLPVTNLNEAESLVMQVNTTSRNECAATEKPFRLLCHCDDEVTFFQNIVLGNWPVIPFRFVAFFLEAAFLKKIQEGLKARADDSVTLRTPSGVEQLEVVEIRYVELP